MLKIFLRTILKALLFVLLIILVFISTKNIEPNPQINEIEINNQPK